jgi:SAM-dependent methyltransferase
MTEAPFTRDRPDKSLPGIDTSVAHAARVYDYLLGGTDHFPVDREVAEQQAATAGGVEVVRADLRANRAFLGRAVRYLAVDAGIRQFLDIGTGIPNEDNVHGVAQRSASDARVVYVDNDPLVLKHASTLLASTSEGATAYIHGDLLEPESILLRAAATLDFNEPVAIMLIAVLHLVRDEDDPYGIVGELLDAVPPGSHLVISHMANDIKAEEMAELRKVPERLQQSVQYRFVMRSRDEVTRFLDGLDVVEPGVVRVDQWRADAPAPRETAIYAAVGRKP